MTVGPTKKPSSWPATTRSRPSTAIEAPCSAPVPIRPRIRSCACRVTTGPISLPASRPGPTLTARARSATASTTRVGGAADGDGGGDRHAPLAGRAERRRGEVVGGEVDVGVGQDDGVVLGAAERLHALAGGRAALVDVAGDRRRADEGDRGRRRGESRRASTATLSPCTTLKTPSGRPASLPELGEQQRGRGVALAGLEHERVAAGDGDGEHPHRDHRREVERRDAGDDAERLAERERVDAGRDLVGVVALEQARDPAGELDDLEPALDLAQRVGEHLAVLVGDQPRPTGRRWR